MRKNSISTKPIFQIMVIVFNLKIMKHFHYLLLKCFMSVMFLLMKNVLHHAINL